MASATFRIGYSAVGVAGPWTWIAYDTACTACVAHDYIKVELQSTAGVNVIAVTLPTGDDAQIAAGMPAVTVDQATKTATFRLDNAAFRSINIQVVVNNGLDSNFAADSNLTKSLQVLVPAASGVEALVVGETDERHRTYGYVGKLNAWASAVVAYNAGHTSSLYVETTGNDATGIRGNQGFPYLTIAGAIADAQDGDVVQVGVGTFAGFAWPELANFAVVGAGMDVTVVSAASATALVGVQPAVTALQTGLLANLTIYNTGAGHALGLDGSALAAPGIFVTGALKIDRVRLIGGSASDVTCAGNVLVHSCEFDDFLINQVDSFAAFATRFEGTVTPSWDHTATLPAGVGGSHVARFVACRAVNLVPSNVAQVEWDGVVTTATTTNFAENGAVYGQLIGRGDLGAVTIDADSVAAVSSAKLDGAKMASLTVNSTAGALRVAVSAKGAIVAGTVTANALTDIDIRTGSYGALACAGAGAASGTIDRTHHIEPLTLIVGDTAPAFAVPFPNATYYVAIHVHGAAADVFVASATATVLTVTSAAALGAGAFAIITKP